jgi:hypothetical protein
VSGGEVLTGGLKNDDPDIRSFVGAPPSVIEILEDARWRWRLRGDPR